MTPQSNTAKKERRAPVVAILGHVDHGKSSLLDYIRKSNITAGEAGGITQHTSAYEVMHADETGGKRSITFLDTPGHAAFSGQRSRGAHAADIAILVVSAVEGPQTQTFEAFEAIKKSGAPYFVAFTKIDRDGADIERAKRMLLEHGIYLEGAGGDTPWTAISSKTGEGMDDLLDMILLIADMEELAGCPDKSAEGMVIESNRDSKKGISATLVIKDGTLMRGMFVVSGRAIAPVRAIEDTVGALHENICAGRPVIVRGFSELPEVGAPFISCVGRKEAETHANAHAIKETLPKNTEKDGAENEEEARTAIKIMIKTDVLGSIEAVMKEIEKVDVPGSRIEVLHTGVGNISENDARLMIGAENPVIIGFNVKVEPSALEIATRNHIEIAQFDIIYKITEWLSMEAEKRIPKESEVEKRGEAHILKVFSTSGSMTTAGGKVTAHALQTGKTVSIVRGGEVVGEGTIKELQMDRRDVRSVPEGNEFGAIIKTSAEIMKGDIIKEGNGR
ncbi:GTP-binding protein [bacterium]|nr:GTP-binding protein [bacterium]